VIAEAVQTGYEILHIYIICILNLISDFYYNGSKGKINTVIRKAYCVQYETKGH